MPGDHLVGFAVEAVELVKMDLAFSFLWLPVIRILSMPAR